MAEISVKGRVEEAVSKGKRRFGLEAPPAAEAGGRVGIVRGALRAFGEGDHEAFVNALDENVEWESPDGANFPGGGVHKGRDAVLGYFIGDVRRTYTEFGFTPGSFLDADDRDAVVVIGAFTGRGVQGHELEIRGVQIWEFTGNAAVRVCTIADSAAFPEVVTEDQQREWKREEGEEREEERDADDEPDEERGETGRAQED